MEDFIKDVDIHDIVDSTVNQYAECDFCSNMCFLDGRSNLNHVYIYIHNYVIGRTKLATSQCKCYRLVISMLIMPIVVSYPV